MFDRKKSHSEETKKILSEKRKAYLATHKHNWSRYSNKESLPEQKFRELIEKSNFKLKQYYIPPESSRFYELDFAHLESKTGFEINGNQHYNNDGTLKDYYKQRQQHFIDLGWKIVEIHYSICFKEELLNSIISLSFSDFKLCQDKVQEVDNARLERKKEKERKISETKLAKKDLRNYRKSLGIIIPRKKRIVISIDKIFLENLLQQKHIVEIAKDLNVSVKLIYKHIKFYNLTIDNKKAKLPPTQKIIESRLKSRKVDRPSKEELKKMLWEMPTVQLAKKFGVSDKAIEKWAKAYNLEKPPRGYWEKLKAGKL